MKCPKCNTPLNPTETKCVMCGEQLYHTIACGCPECREYWEGTNNASTETARPNADSVRWSAGVGEVKAALVLLKELETESWDSRTGPSQKWSLIEAALKRSIATARPPSPTEKLSDSAGETI
jgi:hypothetical protein